jgi:glycosyltransferase involved in cell wall biosynthesis
MQSSDPASIIIGTYNDADIIETTLAALAVQSFPDFEVVLADDGSNQDYAPILSKWAPRIRYGIQHVTHEKHGFRKARILNRAVHVSRFDPLIVMDMDCVPHRDFVRHHLAYVKPGTAITGRRTHVKREVIPGPEKILEGGLRFGPASLIALRLRGKARIIEHGFVSPVLYESHNLRLHGSNFSVYRGDLAAVNGWNEEFEGWGNEDSDLGLRLQHNGVRVRNLRNKVIQFHVMHDKLPSVNPKNDALFERTKRERIVRAAMGLAEIQQRDFKLYRYGETSSNVQQLAGNC